jgi:alpha-tubulin suppressor-like RCC1 family protein
MKYILFLCAFLVNFLSFAATIAAGSSHSLFLDTEGYVWAVGYNYFGQLGLGDNVNRNIPTKIEGLPPIQLPMLEAKIPTKSARKDV